ncbi:UDP-N-acetylmuramoyl-L-alanine--D-glutamate ligase [Rhodothalassium salexigens]|uniref:UDP-N-acetylmuramoyl-L-alanine--D-glutamate ligase n=1 Tax=Rhodothalassium salexigens TaxID=1086 RepID=UPI001913604A|nr:UDP-N-acetylmuramoyl-L-alanine--D-glutamate ligase [Rhodothalassium salexigens]MBK5911705.1 UDP-N-acetylmuramoyl-L-alanine--D-glutamate ligase [Rhodothalassium salexigens]
MIPVPAYHGRRIAVFGLARTGLASCRALEASGATVLAWDDNADRRAPVTDLACDLYAADFAAIDALLLAPGVPLTHPAPHPLVARAAAAGCPILGDVELFETARPHLPAHRLVAITGTNGKSTSTALMAHVAAAAGRPSVAAGNIGVPVLSLNPLDAGGVYVLETSSFQIDLTHSLRADVAILLNITPDHLDRHGSMAGYVRAKERLFEMQAPDATAVIGVDDAPGRRLAARCRQRVVPVSVTGAVEGGVYVSATGTLIDAIDGAARPVADLAGLAALAGRHNWQNAAAVYAAGRALGLAADAIARGLEGFTGLAHRMEPVATRGDVLFVNDSKATNPDAATRALAAFERVHWIAGGRAKDPHFQPLRDGAGRDALAHVTHAYLIGEAAGDLAQALGTQVEHSRHAGMAQAVAAAAARARPGEVVLLSPACASFDAYADFEARGEAFRAAVAGLDAADAPGAAAWPQQPGQPGQPEGGRP